MTPTDQVLDPQDEDERTQQNSLTENQRCPFISKTYWANRTSTGQEKDLFWCSIDLEKFYPSIKLEVIHSNIVGQLPEHYKNEAEKLIKSLLEFSLDLTGWSEEELKKIDIKPNAKTFKHIPTGLYVAGFLANAGLLKVDLEVSKQLTDVNIAHFRYVDDHIILAYSFKDIENWIFQYSALLSSEETGVHINPSKVEPKEFATYLEAKRKKLKASKLTNFSNLAEKACKLDPRFPSPLMTKTLALVSAISRMDFNLLEESEIVSLRDQLEHMLLVDIPETEIPEKTRLSFAAGRLAKIAESQLGNDSTLNEINSLIDELQYKLQEHSLFSEERKTGVKEFLLADDREKQEELLNQQLRLANEERKKQEELLNRQLRRALGLLQKVLKERPDRIRLWTREILLCRRMGVKGLKHVVEDIQHIYKEHNLTGQYLYTHFLSILSKQAFNAAQDIVNEELASWRRLAAKSFLEDVSQLETLPINITWFSNLSWKQYCFGIFCAHIVIEGYEGVDKPIAVKLPENLIDIGRACLNNGTYRSGPVCLDRNLPSLSGALRI